MPDELSGARVFQGRPLTGSPAGRLQDAAAEILAAGTLPRCPHPDQPPLWYLPAGSLTCGDCTGALMRAADAQPANCQICTAPATAFAAWVNVVNARALAESIGRPAARVADSATAQMSTSSSMPRPDTDALMR